MSKVNRPLNYKVSYKHKTADKTIFNNTLIYNFLQEFYGKIPMEELSQSLARQFNIHIKPTKLCHMCRQMKLGRKRTTLPVAVISNRELKIKPNSSVRKDLAYHKHLATFKENNGESLF